MGSNAILCPLVHFFGADLEFDGAPVRPHYGRVQRLVEVELRRGNVVLEPARDGVPPRVNRPQYRVAIAHRIDENPDSDKVINLVELSASHDHLLVNGIKLFRPACDLSADLRSLQVLSDCVDYLLHELFALRCALFDETFDLDVQLGIKDSEREVF